MKRILVLLTLAAALLAVPAQAPAATQGAWKGVVVAKDAARGTVAIASANGSVRTIRVAQSRTLRIGNRLNLRGAALADGTVQATSLAVAGRARTTRLKAVVVRHQSAQKRLLVSAGGSTFVLRNARARVRRGAGLGPGGRPDRGDRQCRGWNGPGDRGQRRRPAGRARGGGHPDQGSSRAASSCSSRKPGSSRSPCRPDSRCRPTSRSSTRSKCTSPWAPTARSACWRFAATTTATEPRSRRRGRGRGRGEGDDHRALGLLDQCFPRRSRCRGHMRAPQAADRLRGRSVRRAEVRCLNDGRLARVDEDRARGRGRRR